MMVLGLSLVTIMVGSLTPGVIGLELEWHNQSGPKIGVWRKEVAPIFAAIAKPSRDEAVGVIRDLHLRWRGALAQF